MEFPVKTNFFPQVRLTTEERQRYVAIGEQSARALRSSLTTLVWKKTMEKDGVTYAQAHYIEDSSLYSPSVATEAAKKAKNELEATASACLIMSATTFAAGTIGEALEALASPVTEDYRRVMHFLYGPSFIDGVCLHTITGKDSDNGDNNAKYNSQAFTAVKWAAFDDGKAFNAAAGSPAGTDYCFLEHSGIHCSEGGINSVAIGSGTDLFGFSIQESIVRDREVPSLSGAGLVRGHLHRTGILILPTDRPDVIQITFIFQTRIAEGTMSDGSGPLASSGKASVLALARQMRRRVAAVGRLYLLLERRRLSKLKHVPRADWVPDDARKICAVCVKPFALRRRKHHCRHCGEVVCSSCAPARDVDLNTATPSSTTVRICTACVVQSRTGAQGHGNYDIFVHRLRDTGPTPTFRSSTISAGSLTLADNNNAEVETRMKSMSSRSSTFSISSDSQISARLTDADYADGSISFYDYENEHIDASSSTSSIDSLSRSSIDSLSDLDALDSLASSPRSNQDEIDCQYWRYGRSSQWSDCGRPDARSTLTTCTSNLGNPESPTKLLERIRGMKSDLFTLATSYRHFSDASNFSIGSSFVNSCVDEEDVAVCRMTWSAPLSVEFKHEDSRQRTRSSYCEGTEEATNVDFINSNEQFTLLCPETLSRQWRTRTGSQVHQDAGEKFDLSLSLSSMSFVSTLSNLTILGDEEDLERRESRESKSAKVSENQVELQVLQHQFEGLDRSLTTATSQLDSFHTCKVSYQPCPVLVDPVAARHQAMYKLLMEELHEIIGLPCPGHKY
ncbi:hypothetical protein KXD40_000737 [Peronospora effusa]|uniref:FYVE-type domain-containing protein n=1 Tax=Peronospora effusa TaxID=542832 RepID=A0A3M6VVE8_9STRA|nr:hypothetical protein DD238_001026 [Peronospora effusa]UIZ20992.1 hypothetical protein KXD40_000737 [Peronospora effusa]